MVSAVRLQSNHYETLGLTPSASSEEIAKAFASLIRLRPETSVARLAQLSMAYETLRDPIKRRAYDATLEPAPVDRNAVPSVDTPREATEEPRLASFIAASLREPEKQHGGEVALDQPQQPALRSRTKQPVELTFRPEEASEPANLRRYVGIGAGALALGVLAIVVSLSDRTIDGAPTAPDQAQPAVTVGLPPPTPAEGVTGASEAPPGAVSNAQTQPAPTSEASTPSEDASTPLASADEQQVKENIAEQPSTEAPPAEIAEDTAVESAPTATAAASMPLPNSTIAHTIERIGYPCGSVASTTSVQGAAAGVFRVTCSSGHSYQATPVNGRYRFRRWGSH